MSFNDFLENANSEAADIMGEPITINSETVQATFDEQVNPWDMDEHGQASEPTTTVVVPSTKVTTIPKKRQKFTRDNTSETFIITEVQISTGNYELTAQNLSKANV